MAALSAWKQVLMRVRRWFKRVDGCRLASGSAVAGLVNIPMQEQYQVYRVPKAEMVECKGELQS